MLNQRFYTSYTGVSLPLNLTNQLDKTDLDNRITYYIGYYDDMDKLIKLEKVVYGEIEFSHLYEYSENNAIAKAVLTDEDDEKRTLVFDQNGQMTEI